VSGEDKWMGKPSDEGSQQIRVTEEDLHSHLKARMRQRGITRQEVERTLNEGWAAVDAKPGTLGNVTILPYQAEWEGQFDEEKEVTVYDKVRDDHLVLLTAKARYGKDFPGG